MGYIETGRLGTVNTMFEVQRQLSEWQATPVVGPLVVSPIKAVVSLAETIVGVVGTIFFGFLSALTGLTSDDLIGYTFKSMGHVGLGLAGLAYSIANFATLGIVGYSIEKK